jgi:hypothetical protein
MAMRDLILEKQPVIFIIGKVASHQDHKRFDKGIDLGAGETVGEKFGKFPSSRQLEKTGQRFFVKLTGEAEAYLVWLDGHGIVRNLKKSEAQLI